MASKGWFNLEAAAGVVPDNTFFEGEPAFSGLGLTKTQRLYGFGACTLGGFVLSILGVIFLIINGVVIFSIMYGLGTVISLVGTGFLIGFQRQLKLMFKPVRIVATLLLLASIGLIFVGAFVIGSGVLCLIFVIIQFLAYTWYSLSYVPYARSAVLRLVGFGG